MGILSISTPHPPAQLPTASLTIPPFHDSYSLISFAKINLQGGLYIGAARADGFHDLRTVYQSDRAT